MAIKKNNDKRNLTFPVTQKEAPWGEIPGNPSKGTFLPIGLPDGTKSSAGFKIQCPLRT